MYPILRSPNRKWRMEPHHFDESGVKCIVLNVICVQFQMHSFWPTFPNLNHRDHRVHRVLMC
jgi:hypothetical protein